jgi:ATP-dependent Clp protease ATP-binding subunit ClpC
MIRLDMSEYMEKHSVSRLIGAPPGYVGYGEGGQLTEPVRRRPYSVILLDEIEKAHREVWNVLLQVLEDGRLTDSTGRVVDFSNTVIILTSNSGNESEGRKSILGFADSNGEQELTRREEAMRGNLKEHFPPEFLNRLDEILFFHPLGLPQLTLIAEGMLRELAVRGQELGFTLSFEPSVPKRLAEEGYEKGLGARPLRRTFVRLVEDPLSLALLEGRIKRGDQILCRVDEQNGNISFLPVTEQSTLCAVNARN